MRFLLLLVPLASGAHPTSKWERALVADLERMGDYDCATGGPDGGKDEDCCSLEVGDGKETKRCSDVRGGGAVTCAHYFYKRGGKDYRCRTDEKKDKKGDLVRICDWTGSWGSRKECPRERVPRRLNNPFGGLIRRIFPMVGGGGGGNGGECPFCDGFGSARLQADATAWWAGTYRNPRGQTSDFKAAGYWSAWGQAGDGIKDSLGLGEQEDVAKLLAADRNWVELVFYGPGWTVVGELLTVAQLMAMGFSVDVLFIDPIYGPRSPDSTQGLKDQLDSVKGELEAAHADTTFTYKLTEAYTANTYPGLDEYQMSDATARNGKGLREHDETLTHNYHQVLGHGYADQGCDTDAADDFLNGKPYTPGTPHGKTVRVSLAAAGAFAFNPNGAGGCGNLWAWIKTRFENNRGIDARPFIPSRTMRGYMHNFAGLRVMDLIGSMNVWNPSDSSQTALNNEYAHVHTVFSLGRQRVKPERGPDQPYGGSSRAQAKLAAYRYALIPVDERTRAWESDVQQ